MKKIAFLLAPLVIFLATGMIFAQGGYALSWWTVSGGGGVSSGGTYTVSGAAGQPRCKGRARRHPCAAQCRHSAKDGQWPYRVPVRRHSCRRHLTCRLNL